jgi:hypothetical protein
MQYLPEPPETLVGQALLGETEVIRATPDAAARRCERKVAGRLQSESSCTYEVLFFILPTYVRRYG